MSLHASDYAALVQALFGFYNQARETNQTPRDTLQTVLIGAVVTAAAAMQTPPTQAVPGTKP